MAKPGGKSNGAKAPTKAELLAKIEEMEIEELRLRRELVFYKAHERWTVYGYVTNNGKRQAVTKEGLRSYDEARTEVVKAALRGRLEAVIVRRPFGGSNHHREDSRQVVERINGGKGWWE